MAQHGAIVHMICNTSTYDKIPLKITQFLITSAPNMKYHLVAMQHLINFEES